MTKISLRSHQFAVRLSAFRDSIVPLQGRSAVLRSEVVDSLVNFLRDWLRAHPVKPAYGFKTEEDSH